MVILLCSYLTIFLSSKPAYADLTFCNDTGETIQAAFASPDKPSSGVGATIGFDSYGPHSEGWWSISPYSCKKALTGSLGQSWKAAGYVLAKTGNRITHPPTGDAGTCINMNKNFKSSASSCQSGEIKAYFKKLPALHRTDRNRGRRLRLIGETWHVYLYSRDHCTTRFKPYGVIDNQCSAWRLYHSYTT
ncbi:MAG: DUF1036 domain-containing protein [Cyanobacteria bacterium MAG CAR3_bin_5]|nr:DUF1036 domain-containing protein [Cyanobacteria bacterium MAG CAR3_bin_5]MCY4236645.1 DUF1036 domain-containing protein [Cyanobacteria bacterium MAG CAR2_bin_4]